MNNVNEHDIELKRFFKEMPITTATTVGFKKLTDSAIIPTKAHPTDSGFDLFADETVIIEPGGTCVVKTGIAVQLPAGYEATVRPRSGITSRTKLRVQLGTVDNEYVGDIGIIVDNIAHIEYMFTEIFGGEDYVVTEKRLDLRETYEMKKVDGTSDYSSEKHVTEGTYIIRKGDKLAQLVVSPVAMFAGVEAFDVGETDRGGNGFGSSDI